MIIVSGRDTNEVLSELDIHANTTAAGSDEAGIPASVVASASAEAMLYAKF